MSEFQIRKCLSAFENTVSAYQEAKLASGTIQAMEYQNLSGFATATGCDKLVKPRKSDFVCDVEIAAKRSLNSGELAYFKTFYQTCDLLVEPGDSEPLRAHIESFPEKYRPAVASLDNKIRVKLGARLLEVGISPVAAYMNAEDVRGRRNKTERHSVVFTIMASAAASDDESFNLTDVIRRRGKAWTAEELAELLSLSKKHIYKLAKTQRMPSYRLGGAVRFDPEAVAGWLEDRSVA